MKKTNLKNIYLISHFLSRAIPLPMSAQLAYKVKKFSNFIQEELNAIEFSKEQILKKDISDLQKTEEFNLFLESEVEVKCFLNLKDLLNDNDIKITPNEINIIESEFSEEENVS